jgi:hypothetical protein
MHDLTQFTMADMAICCSALRRMGHEAGSMEEAAERIVRYLYENLSGAGMENPLALVRMFKTHAYGDLTGDLQAFASRLLGHDPEASMKCLTLLATIGDRPQWCSRHLSNGHKAIPLASEDGVRRIPMIAALIHQVGLEISQVLKPDPGMLADLSQKTFNVFHVPDATDSPNVPAKQEFVIPEGIRSCLGFGGMMPHGDLFAVILFTRVPIPHDTANLFKTLSLSVKTALLPFESTVFSDAVTV